jgi:hypothetical protein
LVSGVVYGLCGYMVCLGEHQFMKLAAGAMPWYLAAILASGRRGRWLLGPTVAMGVLLLAGDPQIAILSSIAGLVLAVVVNRKTVPVAILSPFGGTLLAAVQLVPSLLVVPDTERRAMAHPDRWSLTWKHLEGFAASIDFGANDWVRSTTFGWAAVGLIAFSLLALRTRLVAALWGLTGLSLWLAAGPAGGLHQVARAVIPIWSQLRYPMKSMVLACLTLAVLAGVGFEKLPISRKPLVRAASVLIVLQAVLIARPLLLVTTPDFYEPSPISRVLQRDGVGLTGGAFDRPFAPVIDPSEWATTARIGAGGLGTSLGAMWGLPSLTPSMPGSSWRVLRLFDETHREVANGKLLGVFGVQDVVLEHPKEGAEIIAKDDPYSVVKLRRRLERAYVTTKARTAASGEEAIDLVTRADFAPGREVILETAAPQSSWLTAPDAPAIAARVDRTGDDVTVHASLPKDGLVVLNEASFRGWTATVDGIPTPVMTANALVRAVSAPAGEHTVVFHFQTPGLAAGALISLLSLVALLIALRRTSSPAAAGQSG